MYALYDENGDFKVGTILSEAESSVQLVVLVITCDHSRGGKVVLGRTHNPDTDLYFHRLRRAKPRACGSGRGGSAPAGSLSFTTPICAPSCACRIM